MNPVIVPSTHSFSVLLRVSLDGLWLIRAPIRDILPILKEYREVLPLTDKIWGGNAAMNVNSEIMRQSALGVEEELQKALDDGKWTMNDRVAPDFMNWDVIN